jgi:hypothetical protein
LPAPAYYNAYFHYLAAGSYSSHWYQADAAATSETFPIYLDSADLALSTVVMPSPGTISGQVGIGSAGNVAQAGEVLVQYALQLSTIPPAGGVLTDATGHYTLTNVPQAAAYVIHFTYLGSGDFQGGWLRTGGVSSSVVELAVTSGQNVLAPAGFVPPAASISGRVFLGNTSTPAGAGDVTVRATTTWWSVPDSFVPGLSAVTDATGAFTLTGVPDGFYYLVYSYTGTGDYTQVNHAGDPVYAYSGSPGTAPDRVIAAQYAVSGHVDLATTGNPAGAGEVQVTAYPWVFASDASTIAGQATTDASGNWTIRHLNPYTYAIKLHYIGANGKYIDTWVPQLASPSCSLAHCLEIQADTATAPAVMPFSNGLSGTVVVDGGAGVAGVSVWATRLDPDTGATLESRNTTTGSDGTYSFMGLTDGRWAVYFVSPSSAYAFQWFDDESIYYLPDPIDLSGGDDATGVDATLHRAAAITGTVTTPGGSSADLSAGNVSVEVVVYDYQSHTWVQTGDAYPVTLSAGVSRYSITGLAPDTYRLRFLYDGVSGSALLVSPRISVTAGTTSTYDARINISGANSTDIGLDAITGSKLGITVSGWAVEPGSPSTHVGLALNVGSSWYSVNADQSSADAVEAEADYVTVGPDHGFASTIAFAPGTYNACLWTSEPAGHASVLVACQTVTVAAQGRTAAKIDAMTGSLSGLSFSGYALFPDNDAAAVGVAINIGSSWYGFTANQHNTEGASDVPGASAEHGFVGTIPLPQGSYTACLWVSEPAGPAANAGCRTVVIPAQRPAASHLDSVTGGLGTVAVAGWDLFPDVPSTSVGLAINIGASWYSMTANSVNAGSLTAYPSAGSNHGFASTVAAPVGVDNVCIWTVEPSGPAVNIGCRTVTVTAPRRADVRIDTVTGGLGTLTATGWDVFPDSLSTQVGLAINIGSSWYSMTANTPNSGSATNYPTSTVDHGYTSTITIAPGTYNACIWTVEPSGPAVNIGCRTVTVTAPRPAVTSLPMFTGGIMGLTAAGSDYFPDSPAATVHLAVSLDDGSWTSVTADQYYPYALPAGQYHGYSAVIPSSAGKHTACLWTTEPSGPAVNIGCQTVIVANSQGVAAGFDSVLAVKGGLEVWGYSKWLLSPGVHPNVSVNIGSQWYPFTANQDGSSENGYGVMGFIPITPGNYTVCMWTTQPDGTALNLGCRGASAYHIA